jgi:phage-related protein
MPKSLPAAVVTQIDATNKRPVLLFELYLASTLRFAAYKSNVTFPTGGNTYTAKAITTEGLTQSLEGQIERVTIKFDNVAKDMAAYANNESFFGKKLIIKRVYLDALGDASNYNELFNGLMEQPSEISREALTVSATIGKSLEKKALIAAYQKQCPWVFGGTECNTDGNADLTALTASGTADSGTTSTLVDNALTQADDYWNSGDIEITKGTKTYYRKVKDFAAATDTITLDVELPVAIDNTCTYVLYKGCDKTWECCSADYAYGPSSDNTANFGGCIHIVKKADSE